jgi:hypothetical protein
VFETDAFDFAPKEVPAFDGFFDLSFIHRNAVIKIAQDKCVMVVHRSLVKKRIIEIEKRKRSERPQESGVPNERH